MKFLAIIDASELQDLVKHDDQLAMEVLDFKGYQREINIKPIQRPMVVMPDGNSCYIVQEDLDELIEIIRKHEMAKMFEERPYPHFKDSDLNMHLIMNDDGKWEVKNDERTE